MMCRLNRLKRFWRDPSRARLRDTFGIGLDALGDDALLDREPMTAVSEKRERFEAQLLERAWRDGPRQLPDTAPIWLAQSGAMPGGEVGARAYARMRALAQPMLTLKHERLGVDAEPIVVPIDLDIGGVRLVGAVDNVFRRSDGALHVFYAKPHGAMDFRDLVPFYVDWAVAAIVASQRFAEPTCSNYGRGKSAAYAETRRGDSFAGRRRNSAMDSANCCSMRVTRRTRRRSFFPRTAWAWSTVADEHRNAEARTAWEGSGSRRKGEAEYEPSYAALDRARFGIPHAHVARARKVRRDQSLDRRILDPHRTVLVRTGAETRMTIRIATAGLEDDAARAAACSSRRARAPARHLRSA